MRSEMRSIDRSRDQTVRQLSLQPTFSSHDKLAKNERKSFICDIISVFPWLCVDERESEKRRGCFVLSFLIFSLIPPQSGFFVEGAIPCRKRAPSSVAVLGEMLCSPNSGA